MNTPIERLHTALESLGLKTLQARLENLLEQASKTLSYASSERLSTIGAPCRT